MGRDVNTRKKLLTVREWMALPDPEARKMLPNKQHTLLKSNT